MKLYDHPDDQNPKRALAGCLTIVATLIIVAGFPFFVIWLINLSRHSSGMEQLPYDLTNWLYVIFVLSIFMAIYFLRHNLKMKKKRKEEQNNDHAGE